MEVFQCPSNTRGVALLSAYTKYSNVLSPLTFFLNSFHFPFCYELIVRSESAGFMEIVSDFLTFIYRHETLFFYIRKCYVF